MMNAFWPDIFGTEILARVLLLLRTDARVTLPSADGDYSFGEHERAALTSCGLHPVGQELILPEGTGIGVPGQ